MPFRRVLYTAFSTLFAVHTCLHKTITIRVGANATLYTFLCSRLACLRPFGYTWRCHCPVLDSHLIGEGRTAPWCLCGIGWQAEAKSVIVLGKARRNVCEFRGAQISFSNQKPHDNQMPRSKQRSRIRRWSLRSPAANLSTVPLQAN